MSQGFDEFGPELRALFFETVQELLQAMNEQAMKLDKDPANAETIRELRRIVHTLKGDAAAIGFRELSELSHQVENALALETAEASLPLTEIAFTAVDTITAILEAYRHGSELPSTTPLLRLVNELAGATQLRTEANPQNRANCPWTEYELLAAQQAVKLGQSAYHIRAVVDPSCAMPIASRQLMLCALAEAGQVLATRPESGSTDSTRDLQVLFASTHTNSEIAKKCRIPTAISQVSVETLAETQLGSEIVRSAALGGMPVSARTEPQPGASKVQQPADQERDHQGKDNPVRAENIVRVNAERIDTMINLVGELIIGKSMLQQALNECWSRSQKDPMRLRFADALAFQARALNDLQRAVMKVRMVPVEQLFRRFPRMARDIAKQCGREVEITLRGQDTDLDKGLLDAIAEPLTHLLRNAISHGIEPVQERMASGKTPQGKICLDAYHQGNQVVVEISDDGHGIDIRKVRACAIERGLLDPETAGGINETGLLEMIFRPGFSTAEQITEVSGRGVGLDVVSGVLSRLKGTVEVETDPGKGTRFRLRLPLTLAIIQALLFRVQQQLYAIPLNAVVKIARGKASDLHQVEGREVLQLGEHVLPVIRLGQTGQNGMQNNDQKIFILVVALGERRFGLLVDGLAGEEELVIKPLDDQTVNTDLISGASILGDGKVVLILNLPAVVERFVKSQPETRSGSSLGFLPGREGLLQKSSAAGVHP
jgi:two-component system, chemotaxis family, sensor kinase CheA